MPTDRDIEYVDLEGKKGRVPAASVQRLSVLSDGRGVLYLKDGRVVTVSNGERVRAQLPASGH